jgi:hypothetical protein
MARFGLFHRVYRQHSNGIDAQLIERPLIHRDLPSLAPVCCE